MPITRPATIRTYGSNIYDYNFFYEDIQAIGWSFDSLTNAFTAERGALYVAYKFHYGNVPSGTIIQDDRVIQNIYGGTYGYFTEQTKRKPAEEADWWETLSYIGSTISYVLDFLVSIGRLFIDIIGSLLKAVKEIVILIYQLAFKITT